jgi:hypothetical protein
MVVADSSFGLQLEVGESVSVTLNQWHHLVCNFPPLPNIERKSLYPYDQIMT